MFENACRKLSEWAGTEYDAISISCNFTRITISDADFADKIREIAERYTFARHKLVVEITEDSMEKNFETAKENIVATKALGFTVALDDVGNGYTPPPQSLRLSHRRCEA
jgi:EAL domain-containing protein (putative c-di-GMP-specific phosphodiesterase class I)